MPWYIAFGNVIAWVLVVLVAALPIGLIRLKRALRDKSQAREDRAPFDFGQREPAPGPIMIRGVLRGGFVRTTTTKTGTEYTRSEPLWIDHEGDRIDLTGTVHVVRGTRVRASWKARTYEANDGDVVIVRGTASRTTSSYREQGWQLAPDGELAPILMCADKPASRARALSPAWLAGIFIVAGVGGYFGLNWIGKKQLAKYPLEAWSGKRAPLSWTEPAALAAMLPGTRDKGLAHLYAVYAQTVTLDQDNLDARVEIAEKLEGRMRWIFYPDNTPPDKWPTACEAAAQELFMQSRFEEVLARDCTPLANAAARLALGHYDEISLREDAGHLRALVEIANKRWSAAADALDSCYGAIARSFGGDASGAAQQLSNAAPDSVACRIATALTSPPEDRAAMVMAIELPESSLHGDREHWEAITADLRWALDRDSNVVPEDDQEDEQEYDKEERERELESFVARRESSGYSRERELLRTSFLRRAWLSTIAPDTAPDVHVYRFVAAVDRGDFAAARAEMTASGQPWLAPVLDDRMRTPANVDATMRADARELRADLSHSFRTAPTQVVRFVHELASYRDAAREVGDTEQVTRLQGIIDRHIARFATGGAEDPARPDRRVVLATA